MCIRLPQFGLGRGRPLPPGPRGRILFLTPFNGGIGGIERLTRTFATWVEGSGYSATIVCRYVLPPGPFTVSDSERVRVLDACHWSRALQQTRWDFIYAIPAELSAPKWVKRLRACKGTKVVLEIDRDSELMAAADALHVEVERDRVLPLPHVAATPDPRVTIAPGPDAQVEEDLVLTVFNPYGDEKGHRHIPAFLEGTGRRLVWCYDPTTFASRKAKYAHAMEQRIAEVRHPRLEVVTAPSQADLYALYRRAAGYACFSQREGLGWALLDALALGRPIASRRVGVCRALADFEATEDFADPVFQTYPLPETIGFQGLFARVPDVLAQGS